MFLVWRARHNCILFSFVSEVLCFGSVVELLYFCRLFLLFYVIRDKNQDCSSEKKFPVFDERNIQQPSTEKPLLGIWIPDQSNTVDFEKLVFMERGNPEYWQNYLEQRRKATD